MGRVAELGSLGGYASLALYTIMKTRFTIGVGILALMVAVAAIRIRFAHRFADGTVSARTHCFANLRAIEYRKTTWASHHGKTTNDTPVDIDIYQAFPTHPTCPEGGTYLIGKVGELPTCSLPAHKFSFPLTPTYESFE